MAPEQVRGDAVDHRADIFAFGAVFYEMLGGHSAFSGDTSVERMTAILKSDPPALAHAVPAHLDRIVRRALEKNPEHRFQSATDIAFALEALDGGIQCVRAAGPRTRLRVCGRGAGAMSPEPPPATYAADVKTCRCPDVRSRTFDSRRSPARFMPGPDHRTARFRKASHRRCLSSIRGARAAHAPTPICLCVAATGHHGARHRPSAHGRVAMTPTKRAVAGWRDFR
jgi:hypothetical protein